MRCSIFDSEKGLLLINSIKYDHLILEAHDGTCEVDPDFYIKTMAELSQKLKKEDESIFNSVEAVVVIDIRDSCIVLDENKKPISKAILWLDKRRVELNGSNFNIFEKLILKAVGLYESAVKNSERTFCQWIKKNNVEMFKKMKYYIPLGAYFNYKITNNLVISSADCVGHFPINFKTGKYFSKNHLKTKIFAVPIESLPPIIKTGDVIGHVSEEFSKLSGIKAGLPLVASGSDKSCETLGNGCIDSTSGSISLGTACTIDICGNKYKEIYPFLPSYKAPYEGSFNYELQLYSGFGLITKFIKEFVTVKEKEEAEKLNISVEQYLDLQLPKTPPGNYGLVLQPYWYPALERPEARGSMINFTLNHSKHNIYRAIIEGEAYCLREGLDNITKKTHTKVNKLIVSGGGSVSNHICQIIADVFNIEVYRNSFKESSSLGAAICGFLYLKEFNNPKEAVDKLVKYSVSFKPNYEYHKKYDYVYKNIYLKVFDSVKKIEANTKKYNLLFENKD